MKPDTPHRFVQKAIDLIEVGTEITDTSLDDYAIATVQGNAALKQYLGDRFAKLIGADVAALAVDEELEHHSQAAAIDPVKLIALLKLIWELWNAFKKPA